MSTSTANAAPPRPVVLAPPVGVKKTRDLVPWMVAYRDRHEQLGHGSVTIDELVMRVRAALPTALQPRFTAIAIRCQFIRLHATAEKGLLLVDGRSGFTPETFAALSATVAGFANSNKPLSGATVCDMSRLARQPANALALQCALVRAACLCFIVAKCCRCSWRQLPRR